MKLNTPQRWMSQLAFGREQHPLTNVDNVEHLDIETFFIKGFYSVIQKQ